MPRRPALLSALVCAGLVAVPAPAGLAGKGTFRKVEPNLWATVNVCDTPRRPDTLGVRGSMPGTGKRGEMFMRFRVQWYSRKRREWRQVTSVDADTGFVFAGSSRYRVRQTGAGFRFTVSEGKAFLLRGVVDFEWRAKGKVVRRARRLTAGGKRSAAGADPPGYSAGTCVIGWPARAPRTAADRW